MTSEHTDGENLRDQLGQLIQTIEITGNAILPSTNQELLQSIVDAAATLFGAAAASMALVDEADQTLVFRVAAGEGNEEIIGKRIPLDTGLAGYVVMTGQPLAISNVQEDPRFNKEFAKSTGYVPRSILATPLIWNDRAIGVMEVLDKIDEDSFGMQDMELLGIFARQAAIAIYQSQQYERLSTAMMTGLKELLTMDPQSKFDQIFAVLDEIDENDAETKHLYQIADCINKLSMVGEDEKMACLDILTAFDKYISTRKLYPYS
jgi:signal transduction protein with GAF and PtsI domain